MSVISFKVKKEIKEKMEKYKDRVNWAEELRKFVEERVRQLEAEENMERIVKELKNLEFDVPKGFSKKSVREGRDSG